MEKVQQRAVSASIVKVSLFQVNIYNSKSVSSFLEEAVTYPPLFGARIRTGVQFSTSVRLCKENTHGRIRNDAEN